MTSPATGTGLFPRKDGALPPVRRLRQESRRRGSVMVEFALGSAFVLLILAGTLEFGYTFYVYNQLQSAARDAARYASLRPFDFAPGGNSGVQWEAAVKNMMLYGDPDADGSGAVIVPGLTADNITVASTPPDAVPEDVSVEVNQLTINTFFRQITVNGKPRATFRYMGRVIVP